MSKLTARELQEILKDHDLWTHNKGGSRANLSGANLHGANLYGANLSRANLSGANLHGANLYGANLYGANLHGANLHGANLSGANLHGANLSGANLHGANLYGADLYGANLHGADLSRADLSRANLSRAEGVYSFGPVGETGRIGYTWAKNGKAQFILGCHNGNLSETVKAIRAKYGPKSTYEAQVRLAAKIIESTRKE